MKIAVLFGAVAIVAAPAAGAPHLVYSSAHAVIGVADIGLSCAERAHLDKDDHCDSFQWSGTITKVNRDRHHVAGEFTMKVTSGGDPAATTDLALVGLGDDFVRSNPRVDAGVSQWIKPGLHVRVTGTLNGMDGSPVASDVEQVGGR